MLSPTYGKNRLYIPGLILVTVTLFIILSLQTKIAEATFVLLLQNTAHSILDVNFLFSIVLLVLLVMIFVKRRKIFRVVIGSILGLSSYVCWFSTIEWLSAFNVSPFEQRFLAIVLLGIALWALVSKSSKEKRRHFPEAVQREVINKQKGKCNKCKRKLVAYDMDLDHKNGDRSNNKLSNCQVLCVACHRRRHAK